MKFLTSSISGIGSFIQAMIKSEMEQGMEWGSEWRSQITGGELVYSDHLPLTGIASDHLDHRYYI